MARTYELTDTGRGLEMKNQQKLIHDAMQDGPRTVEQIAAAITGTLVTKQSPTKVVAYYMSTWKKDGIVRVLNEAIETTVQGTNVVTAPAEKQTVTVNDIGTVTAEELGLVDDTHPAGSESAPVSDENLSEEQVSEDIAAEERAEAVSPTNDRDPSIQQRDGETLIAYVFRLVQERGPIWPTDIETLTFGAIRKKSAGDTLRKLMGAQHVAKSDDGYRAVTNNPYRG